MNRAIVVFPSSGEDPNMGHITAQLVLVDEPTDGIVTHRQMGRVTWCWKICST